MSQVKNLRAMFENKGDTSPPDRGRSGATTPVPGITGSDSPRPLSKVRTNFVAIEKDGKIGLRRDQSHESSTSRRRLSMETDAESTTSAPDKSTVSSDEVTAKLSKLTLQETIPESPRHPPEKNATDLAAAFVKPNNSLDDKSDQEQSDAPAPTETVPKSPTKGPKLSTAVNGKAKSEKPKEAPSTAPARTTATKKTTTRPTTISTKSTTSKLVTKSPTQPSAGTTRNGPSSVAKAQDKPSAKKQPTTARPASSLTRPTASSATKKPAPLSPSTSDTVFVKPKPKSPTKPAHLPASLTAPTASSVSKGAKGASSLNPPARSPSRASVSTTGTSTSGKTVRRQPSSINSQRPSLGRPPNKSNSDVSGKKDAPIDEGFLARMMRPTQASSSKTSEKAPVTPPRKTAKRPSLPGDSRHETTKTPGSSKKPVTRQAELSTHSQSAPSKEPSPSPAPERIITPEPEVVAEPTKEEQVEESTIEIAEPETAIAEPLLVEEVAQEMVEAETTTEVVNTVQEDRNTVEPEPVIEEPVEAPQDESVAEVIEPEVQVAEEPEVPADKLIYDEAIKAKPETATREPEKSEETRVIEDTPLTEEAAPATIEETLEEPTEKPDQKLIEEPVKEPAKLETKSIVESREVPFVPETQKKKDVDVEEPQIEEEAKEKEKDDSATQ